MNGAVEQLRRTRVHPREIGHIVYRSPFIGPMVSWAKSRRRKKLSKRRSKASITTLPGSRCFIARAPKRLFALKDATFLWRTYVKRTGHCLLSPRTEQRKIDDGFGIREQSVAKVIFEAQTSPASQHAAAK